MSDAETKPAKKVKVPAKPVKSAAKPVAKAKSAPKANPVKETATKPAASKIIKHPYGIQELSKETGFPQIKVRALLRSMSIPKNGSRYGWDRKADMEAIAKRLKAEPPGTPGRPKTDEKPAPKAKVPAKKKSEAKPMPVAVEEPDVADDEDAEAVPENSHVPMPDLDTGANDEDDGENDEDDGEGADPHNAA